MIKTVHHDFANLIYHTFNNDDTYYQKDQDYINYYMKYVGWHLSVAKMMLHIYLFLW